MATLDAMAKATIAKDVATLTRIYGEDLTYVHGSCGSTETKAHVLTRIPGPGIAEFMRFRGHDLPHLWELSFAMIAHSSAVPGRAK